MNKEFVPYQPSLELKELGFDEPCLAFYNGRFLQSKEYDFDEGTSRDIGLCCKSPLYQQAFRWFREKYDIQVSIQHWCKDSKVREYYYNIEYTYNNTRHGTSSIAEHRYNMFNYEEAELECLIKLIEIVKNK